MLDNRLSNELQDKTNKDKSKAIFDLDLVQQERVGNILFLIGTILAFIAANQEEQSIIQQLVDKETPPSANDSTKTIAAASWFFLAASIIFASTSSTRLKEQIATIPANASLSAKNHLFGREIATMGNFVKVIGFTLAAVGDQIQADNPQ